MKEIRTYMQFNFPVDPAKIVIIPDMDLSYALAGTLVEWSPSKQPSAGLAASWTIVGKRIYRFNLRKGLKWSSGAPVTSNEIKLSLERGLKKYPEDQRSLAKIIERLDCPDDSTIDFHLTTDAKHSNLLGKLTEPNYGIVKVREDQSLDLSSTTGAFYLQKSTANELTLKRNSNWHQFSTDVAEGVVVRKPTPSTDLQSALLKDPWPNLIENSSLLPSELLNEFRDKSFQIWKRPVDKVFVLELGGRLRNPDGYSLIRHLRAKIDRSLVTKGLGGFSATDQVFPVGYQLHNSKLKCDKKQIGTNLDRKLDILVSSTRSAEVIKNIKSAVTAATGNEPNMIVLPLSDAFKRREVGDFDLYAGTYGIADPDPEGIMSYYFESTTPVIPSVNSNFVKRLDEARNQKKSGRRIATMKQIVSDAVCEGHVLPLFHLSTVGIGSKELDFSAVPSSDESVTLSKVRFRK